METKPSPSFGMAFFKSSKLAATAVGLPILVSDYCVFSVIRTWKLSAMQYLNNCHKDLIMQSECYWFPFVTKASCKSVEFPTPH
jgi:hypothetical protein